MSYDELIEQAIQTGRLQNPLLVEAFKTIRRENFLPSDMQNLAAEDRPLPIGYGQTNSQPYTVIFMLELLEVCEGQTILDVGCGSGWTTGLLAHAVGSEGKVIGTERVKQLVEFATGNLKKLDLENWQIEHTPDELGCLQEAPYDRILVSAMAETIPENLLNQLKPGGIIVLPHQGSVHKIQKTKDGLKKVAYPGFVFVPLVT